MATFVKSIAAKTFSSRSREASWMFLRFQFFDIFRCKPKGGIKFYNSRRNLQQFQLLDNNFVCIYKKNVRATFFVKIPLSLYWIFDPEMGYIFRLPQVEVDQSYLIQ